MSHGKIPSNYVEICAFEFNDILQGLEAHRKLYFDDVIEYIVSRTEETFAFVDSNNRVFIHPYLISEPGE